MAGNATASSSFSCTLFVAPSTLPGAGLGVFTGKALGVGDWIESTDVCLPLLDVAWHNARVDSAGREKDSDEDNWEDPFLEYVWSGKALGLASEAMETELITAFWPGLDALVNTHPTGNNNLERSLPEYQTWMGHRHQHAALGSFTPYVGGRAYVKHPVPIGGELFKDYGDNWFLQRDFVRKGPIASDYDQVARLLNHMFWNLHPPSVLPSLLEVINELQEIWDDSPVLTAFPTSTEDLEHIYSKYTNGTKSREVIRAAMRDLEVPSTVRSLAWLGAHGTCANAIVVKPSTVPGIGHGAFARDSWEEGETVAVSPLIVVRNKTLLELHEIGEDAAGQPTRIQQIGSQLALNYCYSHPSTSLALCPYNSGVNFINHQDDASMVNLRLEWAAEGQLLHQDCLRKQTMEEWKVSPPRIAFRFVATRPILEGEELMLDYGGDWKHAWKEHLEQWRASPDLNGFLRAYQSAASWHEAHGILDVLPTQAESQKQRAKTVAEEIPETLELRCHSGLLEYSRHRWNRLRWEGSAADGDQHPQYGFSCTVLHRHQVKRRDAGNSISYTYDVMIHVVQDYETGAIRDIELQKVPRSYLRWFDKPHTTPIHLMAAFRQPIGIPEELLPTKWKIKKPSNTHAKQQVIEFLDYSRTYP